MQEKNTINNCGSRKFQIVKKGHHKSDKTHCLLDTYYSMASIFIYPFPLYKFFKIPEVWEQLIFSICLN